MSTTSIFQPPPPTTSTPQTYTSSATHGSVGPVIGVLTVIMVLGIIAGMIGRICSGRPVMGYGGQCDLEGWIETKCASCIDGRVGPPPLPIRPTMAVRTPPLDGHASGEIREEGEVEESDHHDEDDDENEVDPEQEHQGDEKVSHERNSRQIGRELS